MKKLGHLIVFALFVSILTGGFQQAEAQCSPQQTQALRKVFNNSIRAEINIVLIQYRLSSAMQNGQLTTQDRNVINNRLDRLDSMRLLHGSYNNPTF